MNIKHIEYFVELAKEKNFSKASAILGISQPTLTHCIQKMEQSLGVPLFERNASSLSVTKEGYLFFDSCLKIIDIYKQTVNQLTEMNQGISGSVKIGVSPFRVPFTVSPVINSFHEKFPDVHIYIEELTGEEITANLDTGDLDFIITAYDKNMLSKYNSETLGEEEVIIAVHKDIVIKNEMLAKYIDCAGLYKTEISDFKNVNFILLGTDQLLFRQFRDLNKRCGNELLSFTTCTEISNSLSLADCGAGAALLPSTGLEYYKSKFPDLRFFSIGEEAPKRTVSVLYRKNQYLSLPARELINLLKHKTEEL